MFRRVGAVWLVLALAACCSKSEVKGGGSGRAPRGPTQTFTLFALAEMRGQIGPCGCTSDPLGDISRTAKLVADARAAGPVLVVDAGSCSPLGQSPGAGASRRPGGAQGDLLPSTYKGALQTAAVGLG